MYLFISLLTYFYFSCLPHRDSETWALSSERLEVGQVVFLVESQHGNGSRSWSDSSIFLECLTV